MARNTIDENTTHIPVFAKVPSILSDTDIWYIPSSTRAKLHRNEFKIMVSQTIKQYNENKSLINLCADDEDIFNEDFSVHPNVTNAAIQALTNSFGDGYTACVGNETARKAVAEYLSYNESKYESKDIILCHGAMAGIEMCITALVDPYKKQNFIVARPTYPTYLRIAKSLGITVKFYDIFVKREWKVIAEELASAIDENTAALIIDNPTCPCGFVYSRNDLCEILNIAFKHRVPIICNEVYERMVFSSFEYTSLSSINHCVPVLICGGLEQRFMVPGWKVGWIAIHDPKGSFDAHIRKALNNLSQRSIGVVEFMQRALPDILQGTPKEYFCQMLHKLRENATFLFQKINAIDGVMAYICKGGKYMLLEVDISKFPKFDEVLEFVGLLLEEQSVLMLPGEGFHMQRFLMIKLTKSKEDLEEACQRLDEFCKKYYLRIDYC